MQSGALNESFSDIFGETVDLLNGAGNDSAGVRWDMGEDVPGLGAIRNMMNPNVFNDPGKMSDSQFACADPGGDAGRVHSNSGVPNHAYALMVDGGIYNGFNVSGIGLLKAGKIQYRVLTRYLRSASDSLAYYAAVPQACFHPLGTAGITFGDCIEVVQALDAVQLAQTWPCPPTQPAVPALCPVGSIPQIFFNETFEGGFNGWGSIALAGSVLWFTDDTYATSGIWSLLGIDDGDSTPDHSRVNMVTGVNIPAGARLQFNHSWGFENTVGTAFDGGRVLFSANGGAFTSA